MAIFQNKRRDKEFLKRKLKEFMTTKSALQEILKGDSLDGKERPKVTKTRKEQRKSPETTTKQVRKWHQIHIYP